MELFGGTGFRHLDELVGGGADDVEDLRDGGVGPGGQRGDEMVDGGAEDHLLPGGDRLVGPTQRAEGGQEGEAPAPQFGQELVSERRVAAGPEAADGGAERPGVERVDPVQAPPDADDLAAETADKAGVVRFDVAEHDA